MNILVTGSNGFIGSKLMWELQNSGHQVIGIDISAHCDDKPHPKTQIGDIRKLQDLLDVYEMFKRSERSTVGLVIHCAAAKHDFGISEKEYYSHNEEGTAVLLQFMEQVAIVKLINISTVSVFGHRTGLADENCEYKPDHPYGASKLNAELLSIAWQKKDKSRELIVLRPTVIYGPYNYANVFKLVDMMYKKPWVRIGKGHHIKSIVSRTTVIDMISFSLSLLKPGYQHFNCVDEPYITLVELMQLIAQNPKFKIPAISIPLWAALIVGYIFDIPSKLTGKDLPINSDRMRKLATATYFVAGKIRGLGFEQRTSIEESVREMTDWYLTPKN